MRADPRLDERERQRRAARCNFCAVAPPQMAPAWATGEERNLRTTDDGVQRPPKLALPPLQYFAAVGAAIEPMNRQALPVKSMAIQATARLAQSEERGAVVEEVPKKAPPPLPATVAAALGRAGAPPVATEVPQKAVPVKAPPQVPPQVQSVSAASPIAGGSGTVAARHKAPPASRAAGSRSTDEQNKNKMPPPPAQAPEAIARSSAAAAGCRGRRLRRGLGSRVPELG